MSKIPNKNKFFDLSDYGRKPGNWISKHLLKTRITAVHVTISFFLCGLLSVYFVIEEYYFLAGIALILKSILDAADGELARLKKKPSYIGRYLDSVLDSVLNFILLYTISKSTDVDFQTFLVCYFAFQLQGTVYNYYYLIVRRNITGSDKTSRIHENSFPKALHGESQPAVNVLFVIYTILYRVFDLLLIFSDSKAQQVSRIPNWFLTICSLYGLGFQLLIIAILLSLNLIDYVIPFFLYYSILIPLIIILRKLTIKTINHDTYHKKGKI